MNLPNKLTLLRIILVPVFIFFIAVPVFGEVLSPVCAALFFLAASITDFADGNIARKRGLVTDFGKVMDPLADKFMIFGALLAIAGSDAYTGIKPVFIWAAAVIIFRELAVISLRLVISGSDGGVVPARMAGKVKTVMQIVMVTTIIVEPLLMELPPFGWWTFPALSYLTMAAAAVLTVYSGIEYFRCYWGYISMDK